MGRAMKGAEMFMGPPSRPRLGRLPRPAAPLRRRRLGGRGVVLPHRHLRARGQAQRAGGDNLLARLHVLRIAVPALSERPEDVPELARRFLARFAAEQGKRANIITPEAMALLCAHRWPGNVRQLENAVLRAVVLAESAVVGVAEFPQIAARGLAPVTAPQPAAAAAPAREPATQDDGTETEAPPVAPVATAVPFGSLALLDAGGDMRPLEDIEAEAIRFAITYYRGQMSEVARRLRIGRSTLYRKLDSLGLDAGPPDTSAL